MEFGIFWWHWIILGVVLCGIEIFMSSFVFLWFGIGALLVGGLFSFISLDLVTSLFLWLGFSSVSLAAWFWWLRPVIKRDRDKAGQSDEEIGIEGVVIEAINVGVPGKVRFDRPVLGSRELPAYSDQEMGVDTKVSISEVRGQYVMVQRIKEKNRGASHV